MTTLRLRPDLEDALCALPGIQAVSVVTSGLGEPTEVHVLASPGKAPKQVVRDVQSLAMAAFGLDIDRRIVSVVQIPSQEDRLAEALGGPDAPPAGDRTGMDDLDVLDDSPAVIVRPIVQRISVSSGRTDSQATVVVRLGSDEFTGNAVGGPTPASRPRLVAEATVNAVSELLGTGCDVDSVAVVPVGGHEVAVVVLSLQVHRLGEQLLTGSALLRTYPDDAVVRAVLDGLNRHLAG